MTFEDLRNEVASAVRKENEKLPIGKAISFERLPVMIDGQILESFKLVKTDNGYHLEL